MVAPKTPQLRKLVAVRAGSWQVTLIRVVFSMALCVVAYGIAPVSAISPHDNGAPHRTDAPAWHQQGAQPATYRHTSRPDGATQVQRSIDGGLTWAPAGVVPEIVLQLAPSPVNDAMVYARTGTNLWHSATSGASWTKVPSLPGRPLALAITGRSEPSGLIYLGTDTQGLHTSMDGGMTWQAAGGPLSSVGAGSLAISALAVSPDEEQVVYAAATFTMATPAGQHSHQRVFVSVDDGRRWFEMSPAPSTDQPIAPLTPLIGSVLTVLVPIPLGTQLVSLEVGPPFAAGLYDSDPGVRAATARALGFSDDRSLLPSLLIHLRDPDPFAGDQVAQAIGRLGDAATVPLLMPALSDSNEGIRARAAMALGLLHAEEAIPQLSAMLRHDGPWASRYAAEALAAIGTPAAMAALSAPLADQLMTPARHAAMGGLELAGQPAVDALIIALNDSRSVVRANAAEMLGWLQPADAVADLALLLSDPVPAVQVQAAWALGQINTEPARVALNPAPSLAQNPASALEPAMASSAPAPLAPSPSAMADIPTNSGIPAMMAALLGLAMLTVVLIWKWPWTPSHLGPV